MPGLKAPGLAYLLRGVASSPGVHQGIQWEGLRSTAYSLAKRVCDQFVLWFAWSHYDTACL